MLFKDVPLRTRMALSLYKVYGDSALLLLNRTSLNSVNALLALSRQYNISKKGENIKLHALFSQALLIFIIKEIV